MLRNINIYYLLIITAIFSSVAIFGTSYAQDNTIQSGFENNFMESNANDSEMINPDLAMANNTSSPELNNDYVKDFRMNNDTDQWITQFGNWNLTENGLHGSSSERMINNIILSPIIPAGNEFNINTLFKINDLESNMTNSTAIVYSFIDKRNYEQVGIRISHNDVYLILSKAVNNKFEYVPQYPGIKTDLEWEPGNVYNMTLSSEGNLKHILLNGTQYSFDSNDSSIGMIGLSYGAIKSIDFLTYNYQQLNNTTTDDNSENGLSDTITLDSQTVSLEEKTLPEGSFIPLYDSTPYQIKSGHIAAKFPCNDSGSPSVEVLIGQAPSLAQAELELIPELSTAGELCLYHADLEPGKTNPITDIVLQNNSTDDIEFPETSNMVISVSEISKLY